MVNMNLGKKARYTASITNRTSIFGIMGGTIQSGNYRNSIRSATYRATTYNQIPPRPTEGKQYMLAHNLLSRNPQCSGGVGRMHTHPGACGPCNCVSSGSDAPHHGPKPNQKPDVLLMLDTDYTMTGVVGSYDQYAYPSPMDLYIQQNWGISPGIAPSDFNSGGLLGKYSVFSTAHPFFGESGEFNTYFAINSDGLTYASTTLELGPYFESIGTASDIATNFKNSIGLPNANGCVGAIQNMCVAGIPSDAKATQLQTILKWYAEGNFKDSNDTSITPTFQYIFFIDDSCSHPKSPDNKLWVVKTNAGTDKDYTYVGGSSISPDNIYLAYPYGGSTFQNVACTSPDSNTKDTITDTYIWGGLADSLNESNFYNNIGATTGTLDTTFPSTT